MTKGFDFLNVANVNGKVKRTTDGIEVYNRSSTNNIFCGDTNQNNAEILSRKRMDSIIFMIELRPITE